jgi:hypothetical protein
VIFTLTPHYQKKRKGQTRRSTRESTLSKRHASKLIKQKGIKSMQMARKRTPRKKEEPIYEKLEPNSCMIISKNTRNVLFACNEEGKIKLKRVKIPK